MWKSLWAKRDEKIFESRQFKIFEIQEKQKSSLASYKLNSNCVNSLAHENLMFVYLQTHLCGQQSADSLKINNIFSLVMQIMYIPVVLFMTYSYVPRKCTIHQTVKTKII